jgi:hypothetical protein
MGALCSTESATSNIPKKQRRASKKQSSPTLDKAVKSPKGPKPQRLKSKRRPSTGSSNEQKMPQDDQPAVSPAALLEEDAKNPLERSRTSICESSDASQQLRARLRKLDAVMASAAPKPEPRKQDPMKLFRLQAWIDGTNKTDLLDPQDVKGYQAQVAARERSGPAQQAPPELLTRQRWSSSTDASASSSMACVADSAADSGAEDFGR